MKTRVPFKKTDKKTIRLKLKKIRTLMKYVVRKHKSNRIMKKLFALSEFKKAKKIMFYVSFNDEVDTHKMIRKALKINKEVFVPITDFKNKKLKVSRIRVFPGGLERSKYGILEPKKDNIEIYKDKDIDIIVVPGVGFDCYGNRLGYGGGFYDRLLKKMKVLSIGLAFQSQMLKKVPTEKYDQKVDMVITEKEEY